MFNVGYIWQIQEKAKELFKKDGIPSKYYPSFYQYFRRHNTIGKIDNKLIYNISYIDVTYKVWKSKHEKEFYMTAKEYQMNAGRTINWNLTQGQQIQHALHGMVGEIGEIHSIYQKIFQGHDAEDIHIKKEVGDLLWFIAEYCTANGWELEDIMKMNIDKLRARFPDGFEAEKSIHRKKGDI